MHDPDAPLGTLGRRAGEREGDAVVASIAPRSPSREIDFVSLLQDAGPVHRPADAAPFPLTPPDSADGPSASSGEPPMKSISNCFSPAPFQSRSRTLGGARIRPEIERRRGRVRRRGDGLDLAEQRSGGQLLRIPRRTVSGRADFSGKGSESPSERTMTSFARRSTGRSVRS